jgi:hypothetical protein
MISESGDAILTPSIGAAAGMIVGEVLPGVTVWAIVFSHRSPLAFAEVGSPLSPKSVLCFIELLLLHAKELTVAFEIGIVHGRSDRFVVFRGLIPYQFCKYEGSSR